MEYITGAVLAQIKLSDPDETGNCFAEPVFPPGCHAWAAPHDIDWRAYQENGEWKLRTKLMIFLVRMDKSKKQTWLDWQAQQKILILGLTWPEAKERLLEIKNKLDYIPVEKAGYIRWVLKSAVPTGWTPCAELKRFGGFMGVEF